MRATPKFSLMVLLLSSVGYSYPTLAQTEDHLLASMRKAGEAKAALASAPPYIVVTPGGEAKGYTVEVVNLALKGMGAPALSAVLTAWDAMIPGLQARQFDLVPAGLSITESRCKAVVFSAPFFASQDALYVAPGNPKHLTGYSQIAHSRDVKLAVLTGSVQEAYARTQNIKSEQLVRVPDLQAGVATVTSGRADAFALGQFSIPDPEQKGLEVVVDNNAPVVGMGVAFRKEDIHFRDAFNEQLNLLRSNGVMKKLATGAGIPNWDTLAKLTKASDVVPGCE